MDYYQLSTMLSNIFNDAGATNAALQTAILSDLNRYLPFGVGISSNTIQWPNDESETIAAKTVDGFEVQFLEVLAPLAWPIYYATGYPASELSSWPSYTTYFQPDPTGSSGTLYVMGTPGTFGFDCPNQSLGLLSTIVSLTGATQAEVLTNQLGWFHMVEKQAETMLLYCTRPGMADANSSMT